MATNRQGRITPPSLFLTLSEGARAFSERASLCGHLPWLRQAPTGDGHPVMIIPGFVGDDGYNKPLCRYLKRLGYHATGWNMGRNFGHGLLDPDVLIQHVNDLFKREGQPVTLIGHSLGGVYAREIARRGLMKCVRSSRSAAPSERSAIPAPTPISSTNC